MVKAIITVDSADLTNKLPTFIKGEFGFDILFTLLEDDGTPVILTDKTIKFQTSNLNSIDKKIDGTCTIVDADAGTAKYTVQETDMDEIGIFEAEAEVFENTVSNRKFKLGTFAIFDEI